MILFKWMGIFAGYPWLILIPIALFAIIALLARARFAFIVTLLWVVYGIYEWLMFARILCSGDCNIRMDLLFIYPVLLLLSLTTLIVYAPRIFLKR